MSLFPSSARPSPASPPAAVGWRALLQGERPIWIVCGLLVVAGVILRAYDLHHPIGFSFDERHFVKNARRYLLATRDRNDHPPLGKLLIAGSIAVIGDHAVAWRFPSLLASWLSIGLAAALGKVLFKDRLAAMVTAAIVAADGFLLVYARTALLDGVLVSLMLASALAAVAARRPAHLALAAVFAGMAACVKFSGIVMVVPVMLAMAVRRPTLPRWAPLLVLLTPLTYGAIFAFALLLTGLPAGPLGVVDATRILYETHLGKSRWDNPWVSAWYTWFLPTQPVVMRWERNGDIVRTMVGIGNLAVWWASHLLLIAALWDLVRRGPRSLVERMWGSTEAGPPSEAAGEAAGGRTFLGVHARAVGWACLLWLLPLLPWMVTKRDSYLYHYLPSYAFGAVLLGGGLAWLLRARPRLGWSLLGAITLLFVIYLPIWIALPIPRAVWRALLFVPMWR